jgi:hypothetical protein
LQRTRKWVRLARHIQRRAMPKHKDWEQDRPTLWCDMTKHRRLFRALQKACKERDVRPAALIRAALAAYLGEKP